MLCSPYPSPKALGDMGTEAGRKGAEAREKVLAWGGWLIDWLVGWLGGWSVCWSVCRFDWLVWFVGLRSVGRCIGLIGLFVGWCG